MQPADAFGMLEILATCVASSELENLCKLPGWLRHGSRKETEKGDEDDMDAHNQE